MQLGSFRFSIDTAAYQSLRRSLEVRWPSQPVNGAEDVLQFTGITTETIELEGVIYPFFRGGSGQLDRMRSVARNRLPLSLIAGTGAVLGLWVITRVTEGQTVFAEGGEPRRQEFGVALRRYDPGLGALRAILPF